MWYFIASVVVYSLLMGWGLAKGEVPEARRWSFFAGAWLIGGLAISLCTIVVVTGELQPQAWGWDLLPIMSMWVMVMGFYGLSVQWLFEKSERITFGYLSRLRREQRREDASERGDAWLENY